jgi:hypothetical protein
MSAISELMTEHRRHLDEVDHVRRPPLAADDRGQEAHADEPSFLGDSASPA